jgi:crotonobetainyl-CoA:carnitine CoA-transferase CaiB-like acyl-CoA transferase
VGNPADLFEDAHLRARGLLEVLVPRQDGAPMPTPLPALPVEMGPGRDRPALLRQPPRIGEHNAEVLGEAGLDAAEIAALSAAGVVVAP